MPNKRKKLRSGFEDRILASAKAFKERVAYETETLDYIVPYSYKPDFVLTAKSGKIILIETKGGNSFKYFNTSYRKKWKCMYETYNGKYDIRLIFEKNFKLGKILTASQWCDKLGVKYHIGDKIPREWFNE